jgi:hypothetical protein
MKKRPTLTRRKTTPAAEAEPVRIHKLLADAGIGSRREIERWIGEGRISVNGRPAEVGERLTGAEKSQSTVGRCESTSPPATAISPITSRRTKCARAATPKVAARSLIRCRPCAASAGSSSGGWT